MKNSSDVDIAIEDRTIVGVGRDLVFAKNQVSEPIEVIDGRERVALPAFFNAHTHAAMTLERGWAEDLPFERWLNEKVWVAESALEEEDVYWGVERIRYRAAQRAFRMVGTPMRQMRHYDA